MAMRPQLSLVNVFAADCHALAAFYRQALGLAEVPEYGTDMFVMLESGGAQLGINGPGAYALLDLEDLASTSGCRFMLNFEMASMDTLQAAVTRAVSLGARLRKRPYVTPYGYYQAVLQDPEGNIFRLNYVVSGPPGQKR